jgi:hypothetical protein
MKYILTLVLLALLCSCVKEDPMLPSAEIVASVPQIGYIYKVTIEGHDYLYSYHVGMIHSASCKSPEHYDTK